MELGNLFGTKNSIPPPETFIAIQIQDDLVKTAVWQVQDGVPEVVSFGSVLPWSDSDSLVVAVDNSLGSALQGRSEDPDRVVLGLPDSWIKADKISIEYAPTLKNLLTKLQLTAVGFVVMTEALVQHLKNKEGIPPTAIILELSLSKVLVSVVRLGRIIGREEVARSDDLAKDVAEGLARMELDQLPARFIIINGSDPEAEQQLSSYSWQDDLSFLHLPKVELPDPHFSIEAVALSGGSEAAKSLGLDIHPALDPDDTPDQPSLAEPDSTPIADPSPDSSEAALPEDFGFTLQGSSSEDLPIDAPQTESDSASATTSSLPSQSTRRFPFSLLHSLPPLSRPSLSLVRPSLPQISLPFSLPRLGLLSVLPILLLTTTAVVVAGYFFLSHAQIQVMISTQALDQNLTVAIGDQDHATLPTLKATPDQLEIELADSLSTTGEAVIGDKAKGEVTIYNKTDTVKSLPIGTILATTSNLKFVTTAEASIAAQVTRPDLSGTDFGKATIPTTAVAIGEDSNIAADTSLLVAKFPASSLEAKVNSAFSGGTSRTVQAVGKADHQKLLETLTEKIKAEATAKINSSSNSEQVIALNDLKITQKSYDKKIGEEATTVSLTLKAQVPLLRYQKQQLDDIIQKQITQSLPAGFSFEPQKAQISITSPVVEDDQATASVTITAHLTPNINPADYLPKIKGKSLATAKSLLQTIPGYEKVKFSLSPPLPLLSTRLPFLTKNISLTVIPLTDEP